MYITTTGLVLRAVPYKETSVILTVLTASEGKVTVTAKGARRKGSKMAASVQPLAFSEMTLFENNGRWTLTEAKCIELFEGLQYELDLLSLGNYFAELMEAVSNEEQPCPEILSLGLNALFALSEKMRSKELIKAAFEMRLMAEAGYEPELSRCSKCECIKVENPMLDIRGGVICCSKCRSGGVEYVPLCDASVKAMLYIMKSESKKLLSFSISEKALKTLGYAAEQYVKAQLDRGFRSLDYYKTINAQVKTNDTI